MKNKTSPHFHVSYRVFFSIITVALTISFGHINSEEHTLTKEELQLAEKNFQKAWDEPGAVLFTPPSGWRFADPKSLPKSVKVMFVGKGENEFPPSINLGAEVYSKTLKEYLKRIKEINDSQGAQWKDLGKIQTQAGSASLSQLDTKTEWGEVRMMHVIFLKDGVIYILTGAALKNEFPKFYKDFFDTFQTLRFNP